MSTKTIYKRIALVAVATLGAGVLSVAPASADDAEVAAGTVTALNAKAATANTNVAGATQTFYVGTTTAVEAAPGAGDNLTITYRASLTTFPTGGFVAVSPSASGTLDLTGLGTDAVVTDSLVYTVTANTATVAETISATGADGMAAFTAAPTVPGDYVVTIWHDRDGQSDVDLTEARQTVAFTIVAGAGFSAGLSSSILDTANSFDATADEEVRVSSAAGTNAASIELTLLDTTGAAKGGMRVSAEVSGPGLVDVETGLADAYVDATVRAEAITLAAGVSGATIHVTADGTAGAGTITIKVQDATTLATLGTYTETVYFYGTLATLEAKANYTIARANATERGCSSATDCDQVDFASTPFVQIVAKDSAGNLIPGLTVTAKIADAQVIQASTVTAVTSTAVAGAGALTAGVTTDLNGLGYYNASVAGTTTAASGSSTTITYESTIAGTTTVIKSNAVTIKIGGGVATETITLDTTSYAPGQPMLVTRTAKDSAGNPVYDGLASPAVTFTKAVGGTTPAAGTYVGGVSASATAIAKSGVFAPVSRGEFKALATSGDAAGTALSFTATVDDTDASAATDAANEATDAANAATDAALAAADAADAATAAAQDASDAVAALSASVSKMISSLKAQITSLTNLVIKIQKKVKA